MTNVTFIGLGRTTYKLMINLQGAIQSAAVAEGMALAERAGLNLQTVAATLSNGKPQAHKWFAMPDASWQATTTRTSCSLRNCA